MKRFIFSVFLLILCLRLEAHGGLSYLKEDMRNQAMWHHRDGVLCLMDAEKVSVYIPNLADKEHFKAVIAGAVASIAVPDARGKLLAIGLALLSSLATDSYDQYCFVRTKLHQAAYHFEMSNLYNLMLLHVPASYNRMNTGSEQFFTAINNLTVCIMLTECIEDEWAKRVLYNYFEELRGNLIHIYTKAKCACGERA